MKPDRGAWVRAPGSNSIRFLPAFLLAFCAMALAQTPEVCPRPEPGSAILAPADLRSSSGTLTVEFSFRSIVDKYGNSRYCYIYQDTVQAPTLRVSPGDELVLKLKNDLPAANASPPHEHSMGAKDNPCASGPSNAASTNLHFHGLSLPPVCHQDDVLRTSIQPGDSAFEYRFKIPADQPPGLYWYHPHPHGWTDAQVLGGASGAIVVEGIERAKPETAGLLERILVLRDQLQGQKSEDYGEGGESPKDISINFVPSMWFHQVPAIMNVRPAQREFWRILNAAADTYFDLQLVYQRGTYDWLPEPLHLIALDGVPLASGDTPVPHVLLTPGARAEFIVTTPPAGMAGRLVTRFYETGPHGQVNPERIVANLVSRDDSLPAPSFVPGAPGNPPSRTALLEGIRPAAERNLYLSEDRPDLLDRHKTPRYFITVEGRTPQVFDMNFKQPDIVVQSGTVEDWTVQNRAREAHTFHIHQLHFQLLERDGKPVQEVALRDTIDLPFWDGQGPYPSVKLRMDFRSPSIVGTFVYHCHILEHEDGGMMGVIEVKPAAKAVPPAKPAIPTVPAARHRS